MSAVSGALILRELLPALAPQRAPDAPARDAREADREGHPEHDDGELDRHAGLLAFRSAVIAIRETSRTRGRDRPARPVQGVGRATIAFVLAGR
jgi:hypothetical protein